MKKQGINIGIVAVILSMTINSFISDEDKKFVITIEQNGKQIEIVDNEIVLEKGVFDIIMELPEPMGVLVNASFNSVTYELASKNKHFDKLPGFKELGMADGLLNSERMILLSDDAPNYWFYDNDTENRFNNVVKTNTGYKCTRTVEKLIDTGTQERILTTDVKTPLYLVFISYKRGEKITDQVEVQREYVKIKWEE